MAESNTTSLNDQAKTELLYSWLPGRPLKITISLVALCVLIFGLFVHRAVYKLLWRFPNRYINQIMYPYTVLTTILLPFYFITASARNFVYPLKNYTGELYCYVYEYSLLYGLVVYQHLSLFINLFRYICIVHGNTLMSHGISMKKLARITLICIFVFPAIIWTALTVEKNGLPTLNSCLGKSKIEDDFAISRGFVCNGENWLENLICQFVLYTYIFTSCNVLEGFLLIRTYIHIKVKTNEVKGLIGKMAYQSRKKDNGMIFNISLYQWMMEVCHMMLILIFFYFAYGKNIIVDRCASMFNALIGLVIHPAFIFMGDFQFRRNLEQKGFIKALKKQIFD